MPILPLWLMNIFGWIVMHKRIVFYVLGAIVLVIAFGLIFRSCGKDKAKIDLETVDKINNANDKDRKAELQRVIEDNANVVRTADNRTNIAETNVIERNRLIDEKVKEVDAKIQAAKQGGHDVTQSELQCILVPGDCE